MNQTFFPKRYNDELIYSVIARYHLLSGNYSNTPSMKSLFNYQYIVPSIALQTRLGVLSDNIKSFGIDFETLLYENTMFPYLMVFTPPESYERVYQWAKYPDNRSDRFATGAIHRNMYPEKMMYCKECFKEETLLFGEGYWHRIHQTPGIVVCKKHRCPLLPSCIPTFYHRIGNYQVLQEEVLKNTDADQNRCDDFIHTDGIFDDTKFLYDNFIRIRKLFTDYNYCFRDAFLPGLINKQLATKTTLKNKEIIESFISFYGADYLCTIGLSVSDSLNNKWPINLCREKSRHHTYALEYILMARFLFGSFENFIYEAESQSQFKNFTPSTKKRAVDKESLESYRNKWLEIISQSPNNGRVAVRKLGESTYRWLRKNDIQWLKEHLPEKKLPIQRYINYVDWCERDISLSEQVNSVIEKLKFFDGKPKRISESAICKVLDCKAMFINNRNKLPLTSFAIKNAIETVEQFRLRRCYWIIETLTKQGIQPTITKVIEMLYIYENKEQWKKIIEAILIEKGVYLKGNSKIESV